MWERAPMRCPYFHIVNRQDLNGITDVCTRKATDITSCLLFPHRNIGVFLLQPDGILWLMPNSGCTRGR